jgi:hypothetical protein
VTKNGIVASRNPGGLKAFAARIIDEIREDHRQRRHAAE